MKPPRARLFSDKTTAELVWSEWRSRGRMRRDESPSAPIEPNEMLRVSFPLSHLVGPFEEEESVYIYAEGQGSHIVMSIEALPLIEELSRRTEFCAQDAVHWSKTDDCTWMDIEPVLTELLNQGYLMRKHASAAA